MTLGWNLKICIYNKFPGDADVTGPWFYNSICKFSMLTCKSTE